MDAKINPPICKLCANRLDYILQDATEDERHHISGQKSYKVYKRGEVIFHEGQRPTGLFCINEGKVKVYKLGDEGREQIVRLDKPGDVLGYRALISNEPYQAAAAAIEACSVVFIPSSVIFEMMEKNPEIAFRMMQIFSDDLKNAENRLTDFTQKPVRERLAQTMLSLSESYGTTEDGYLGIYLTRQEWANITGTTTETAIRTMSDLNKEGLIEIKGKKIALKDQHQLEALAEF